jgi:hypothetical protein
MGFDPHRGVQAESVDVGAQRLAGRVLAGVVVFFLQIDTPTQKKVCCDNHLQKPLFQGVRVLGAD